MGETQMQGGAALSVEDKLAIQETIHRFAHCSDYGDWDGLAELYTPDIVTEMDGQSVSFSGIEGQLAHAQKTAEMSGGKNRHYYLNMLVDGAGDSARAHYCFLNVFAGTEPMKAAIITSGRQIDTLARTERGWKIAHRRVTFDQDVTVTW